MSLQGHTNTTHVVSVGVVTVLDLLNTVKYIIISV